MTLPSSSIRASFAAVALAAAAALLPACSSASGVDSDELKGASEQGGEELTGTVTVGADVRTLADVNLRTGASTSNKVLRVIPEGTLVTVERGTPTNGFYQVKHQGTTGWVYGVYLRLVDEGDGDGDDQGKDDPDTGSPGSANSRDGALDRAKSVVGFSYWWGHGRWNPDGVTSSNRGSCSGSCPSCSHSGSYGADCSGFVAKAWLVPSSNDDLTDDEHPYSTVEFSRSTSQWSVISRDALQKADALAYHSGSAGHVVLYSSGDAWGAMHTYECKGCSAGCVYNLRSLSSAYKPIRRKGW